LAWGTRHGECDALSILPESASSGIRDGALGTRHEECDVLAGLVVDPAGLRGARDSGRGTDALAERKLQNYDTEISGRARKAAKSVSSADWSVLLEPFGVVRRSDPNDRRVLIELES